MVAERGDKQKQKKGKAQPQDSCEGSEKYKEFNFQVPLTRPALQ